MSPCRKSSSASRAVALALALPIVATPVPARSAAPQPEAPPPATAATAAASTPGDAEVQAALAEAQSLYRRGEVEFETANYAAAIELWTEAYSRVPDVPQGGRIKVLLIYNIATAREQAFAVDRDVQQLRKAKILLESFEASIPALYDAQQASAEIARVRDRIAGIERQIADAERDPAPDASPTPAPAPTPPTEAQPDGRGLRIAGAVLLGVGVGGLAAMGAGLGIGAGANDLSDLDDDDIAGRRDQFARGRTGNALAIAGGVAGGVLLVAGAVLLGIGMKRKQRATAWRLGPGGLALRF